MSQVKCEGVCHLYIEGFLRHRPAALLSLTFQCRTLPLVRHVSWPIGLHQRAMGAGGQSWRTLPETLHEIQETDGGRRSRRSRRSRGLVREVGQPYDTVWAPSPQMHVHLVSKIPCVCAQVMFQLAYNADRFDQPMMALAVHYVCNLVEALVAQPSSELGALKWLDSELQREMLEVTLSLRVLVVLLPFLFVILVS